MFLQSEMILPSDNKRKGSVTLLATIIFLQINTLQQTCNVICNKIEEKYGMNGGNAEWFWKSMRTKNLRVIGLHEKI